MFDNEFVYSQKKYGILRNHKNFNFLYYYFLYLKSLVTITHNLSVLMFNGSESEVLSIFEMIKLIMHCEKGK